MNTTGHLFTAFLYLAAALTCYKQLEPGPCRTDCTNGKVEQGDETARSHG
jgi:hypothetical protein